ncbi:MAG: cytochrome c3 family protein [Desulfobacterales bacterium]|nr:cytochrome c3 family protein [Desulfobacterales bacterium]
MNKRLKQILTILTLSGIGMLFLVAGINAAEEGSVPDVMTMKNEKAFPQHRMGIVEFDHKTHAEDYGIGCGDCHHDENGEPLTDLKAGDAVQSCYECHDKDGRPRRDPSMSPEEWEKEQLNYYYGAIHENCMGCHKEMGGPKTCTECHPRPER